MRTTRSAFQRNAMGAVGQISGPLAWPCRALEEDCPSSLAGLPLAEPGSEVWVPAGAFCNTILFSSPERPDGSELSLAMSNRKHKGQRKGRSNLDSSTRNS